MKSAQESDHLEKILEKCEKEISEVTAAFNFKEEGHFQTRIDTFAKDVL